MKSKILIVLAVLGLFYIAGSLSAGGTGGTDALVCPLSTVSQADCRLCGDGEASPRHYDGQSPMILLCLNTWEYTELRLFGQETSDHFTLSGSTSGNPCGWYIMANPARHTAGVTLIYGDASAVSFDRLAEQLCQDCLNEVFQIMTAWPPEDGCPRCALLMDTDSGALYPVSSSLTEYYINDFWVHIDHNAAERRDQVYLVWNPIS